MILFCTQIYGLSDSGNNNLLWLIVLIVIALVLVIFLVVIAWFGYKKYKEKQGYTAIEGGEDHETYEQISEDEQ